MTPAFSNICVMILGAARRSLREPVFEAVDSLRFMSVVIVACRKIVRIQRTVTQKIAWPSSIALEYSYAARSVQREGQVLKLLRVARATALMCSPVAGPFE